MKVLISHFFNEEYLLPWWLKHHRELFDHGVLIDNHSTDKSVEICRELVPDWEVVTSRNPHFSALKCDFEVMQHEQRFVGAWKMVLNTTEFLVGGTLEGTIEKVTANGSIGAYIPGAVLVDDRPEKLPSTDMALVDQKSYGFWEADFPTRKAKLSWFAPTYRTRLLHRYDFGAYAPGRHSSMLPKIMRLPERELGIWWYGFSPWTPEFLIRKTQVKHTMDPQDVEVGFGVQHLATEEELAMRRTTLLKYASDLTLEPPKQRRRFNLFARNN